MTSSVFCGSTLDPSAGNGCALAARARNEGNEPPKTAMPSECETNARREVIAAA
jgi:hypothetical protein